MSELAARYTLAAQYCTWAGRQGGRDEAIIEAEKRVASDADNDLDFVVMSVLNGHIDEINTRSMVRGLIGLGVVPAVLL